VKYIHYFRAFAFAVTIALALGGTMHGALAAQVKIYVDFSGGPEPVKGETQLAPVKANWIPVDSARWTTTTTSIPGGWNRVENKSDNTPTQSIGSQTGGAGAGKVTLTQAAVSKLTANGLDITLNAAADKKTIFDLAKQARAIPVVRIDTYEVTAKGLVPVYSAALNDVLVTSVDWKGQDTDSPTANISLKYSSSTIEENTARTKSKTPDDPTIPAGWNRVNNSSTDLTNVPIS
jgi:type VI protein secretion system component Hcp